MQTKKRIQSPKIIFLSHEEKSDSGYLVSLLKRHPDIYVFEGGDQLIDNLLKYPVAPFSIHNTVFFEVLFELMHDQRFLFGELALHEFDEVGKSKNCFEAFFRLMKCFRNRNKHNASTIVYSFKSPVNFKTLFDHFIIKDLHAKYVHLLPDQLPSTSSIDVTEGSLLASVCYGVLQLKKSDFICNYEYEYKRLFSFLNSLPAISEPIQKKRLYKKAVKLSTIENSWYSQVVPKTNILEGIFVEKVFRD